MRRIAAALLAGVLFLAVASGCGKAGGAEPAPEASPDLSAALGEEEQALFHQILLFLQEGFRDHRVEDSYTVFFPPPEDRNGRISLALWDGQDAAEIDAYQLAELRELWADAAIEDFDGRFYLTEDGLGLIGSISRYLVCVEAKLSDLGIDFK